MKVLLDECLPKRLSKELTGHETVTVPMMGWAGVKNGKLLELIGANFDVFIIVDGGIEYQHRLENVSFGIIILHALSNKFEALRPLAPEILRVLARIQRGDLAHVPELETSSGGGPF